MIKVISAAMKHPTNRSLEEFHHYWVTKHGPLFAKTPELRRYVQHHSTAEMYGGGSPQPNMDGASIFWFDDDIEKLRNPPPSPKLSAITTARITRVTFEIRQPAASGGGTSVLTLTLPLETLKAIQAGSPSKEVVKTIVWRQQEEPAR